MDVLFMVCVLLVAVQCGVDAHDVKRPRVNSDNHGNLEFVSQGNVTFRTGQSSEQGTVTGVWLDGRLLRLPDSGPQGPQGSKGDGGMKGEKGQNGLSGQKGEQGAPGVDGASGIQGPRGDSGLAGKTGEKGRKGEVGVQGIKGVVGAAGQKGATGLTGSKGDKGILGQKGGTGAAGLKGVKGEQGKQGAAGTDGKTGPQGPPGPQKLVTSTATCNKTTTGLLRYEPNSKSVAYCDGALWLFLTGDAQHGTVNNPGKHCADLKQKGVTKSGAYWIKPSQTDPAFQAYCEMQSDGGGWTLIIKMDGTKTTFSYDKSIWKEKKELNPSQVGALDKNECKLQSYWTLSFTEMRLGMQVGSTTRWITFSYKASSLFSLTSTGSHKATNLGRNKWKSLIGSQASLQPNCNQEGFNNIASGHPHDKVRIGIIANQENDCSSVDSRLGFGGYGDVCGVPDSYRDTSCGNTVVCSGDNGDKNIPATGFIMAR